TFRTQHLHICLMFTDAEVSCQFGKSCILPCRFTPGDDLVIHWIKLTPTQTEVHSFYYNDKDQWGHLDQKFGGRTSLFQDQISKGNASLQLTGVMVQDQGRYQCQTSTATNKNTSFLTVRIVCVHPCKDMNAQTSILLCFSLPPPRVLQPPFYMVLVTFCLPS
uniref:Ig-like domain-containing protein n=1 Tax=Oryzias sinensis TaxID=183150 RepID=A0A8C7YEG1_9TELE